MFGSTLLPGTVMYQKLRGGFSKGGTIRKGLNWAIFEDFSKGPPLAKSSKITQFNRSFFLREPLEKD